VRQKNIQCYLNEDLELMKESIFVDVTLRRVPGDLLREFARRVAVNYPGGISEAIQDLMKRALR
jgi:hypothetical protein